MKKRWTYLLGLLITPMIYAGAHLETKTQAKYTIKPCTPGTNNIRLSSIGLVDVDFCVTNNTPITRKLTMRPIAGVLVIDKAGISSCVQRFKEGLVSKETCILTLRVDASASSTSLFSSSSRPEIRDTAFSASQPAAADSLNVSVTTVAQPPLMAAGMYYDGTTNLPLVPVSTDLGISWGYPTLGTTSEISDFSGLTNLQGGSCNNAGLCIVTGGYQSTTGLSLPLVALSQNFGVTWSYPAYITTSTNIPNFTNGISELPYASCNNAGICIAAGSYNGTGGVTLPLIAITQNSGQDWSYPVSATDLANVIPAYENFAFLNSANCNNEGVCVAAGNYEADNGLEHPLMAVSTNIGSNSWNYPESVTNPATTPAFQSGSLTAVNCYDENCIGAGNYFSADGQSLPLVAASSDSGSTWTYPNNITNPVTNPAFMNGIFNGASCNSSGRCLAVGQYTSTDGNILPLVAISDPNDMTSWSYLTDVSTANNIPLYNGNSFFNAVGCYEANCIAVGSTFAIKSGVAFFLPLLAYSTDYGSSWTYSTKITDEIKTLPDPAQAVFKGASCNETNCIASGVRGVDAFERPLLAIATTASGLADWRYPTVISDPRLSIPSFHSGALFAAAAG
ncbi:MAG: hypothetical protein P1U61_09245 [Legionellaceae bacterium]|nr:hypothetical protein [Legionellaceae bacterium]